MCHRVHEVYSFEPPGFYLVGGGETVNMHPRSNQSLREINQADDKHFPIPMPCILLS